MESYQGAPLDMSKFRRTYFTCGLLPLIVPWMGFILWFMYGFTDTPGASIPVFQVVLFAVIAVAAVAFAPRMRSLGLRQTGPVKLKTGEMAEGEAAAVFRISTSAISGMALPEVAVLLGFVLGFLSDGNWTYFIVFSAIGVVGWAIMFPRPAQLREWYALQMGHEPAPSITR